MYLLKFVSRKETVTSEKPISLEDARQAWERWEKYNDCQLINLEIEAVDGAPEFTPFQRQVDVESVELSNQ
jgi:hypothetical protein